jgi:toxin ParE1/3/4
MKLKVGARPQAQIDVIEAANWYDTHRAVLGDKFIEEIVAVFDSLETSPLLYCRRHPTKNIRWRYPKRFPYRVIYEVIDDHCCGASCSPPGKGMAKASLKGCIHSFRDKLKVSWRLLHLIPNQCVLCFSQQERAHNQRQTCNHDGIIKPSVDISRLRYH